VSTQTTAERAILVTVVIKSRTGIFSAEDSQEELARLAGTAGAEIVGKFIQTVKVPSRAYYIGKGKLSELINLKSTLDYTTVIIDDELSPLQQRNLEGALNVKVIDRVALILDIFAGRANSREGQLQVELAQHQYLFPRLAGQWSHLERLGGGIGTRGPGESQLETDRRLINKRISRLKEQIEKVRKQRLLHRQKRQKTGIPVVALVGYTNAGKSTLLNAFSQADIASEDKLFTTLDPTTRRVVLPDKTTFLMSDTVGFIRKLPPTIIKAFRATLEELHDASILLHVVDITSHNAAEECQVVEDILKQLDLLDKPRITVLNKIDLLPVPDRTMHWGEDEALNYFNDNIDVVDETSILVSAVNKWGFTKLLVSAVNKWGFTKLLDVITGTLAQHR